jgi:transposase
MPKPRPPYPAPFRQQMVELVQAGRTPAQLAREFNVSAQSISTWVAQAAADRGKPVRGKDLLSSAEREELTPRCVSCRRSATSWQRLRPGSWPRARRRPAGLRTREREPG